MVFYCNHKQNIALHPVFGMVLSYTVITHVVAVAEQDRARTWSHVHESQVLFHHSNRLQDDSSISTVKSRYRYHMGQKLS